MQFALLIYTRFLKLIDLLEVYVEQSNSFQQMSVRQASCESLINIYQD